MLICEDYTLAAMCFSYMLYDLQSAYGVLQSSRVI